MTGQEVTNRFPLDSVISELCDSAQLWLMMAATVAWRMGTTLPLGIAAMLRSETPRIHTGYQPEAVRRNVRYRKHCDGLGASVAR